MRDETDPLYVAQTWIDHGADIALATVLSTWGSAPRPPGSVMAIRSDGAFAGSVSAGCVEGAVIDTACVAITDGRMRRLPFGIADSAAWSVGLTCGGRIEILIEPLTGEAAHDALRNLNAMRRKGLPAIRAVNLETGACRIIDPALEDDRVAVAAAAMASRDTSGEVTIADNSWLLSVFNPPVDLAIIGAVHIAQALVRMATPLGYRMRVIDPRAAFATTERFTDVALIQDYPDEAFAITPLHCRSAVVALAHDLKIDDPGLIVALRSPAFYVGALGSRKTQASRLSRLREYGLADGALARLHGPVGLAIGSKSPEEIAVAILADIIATLRHAPAASSGLPGRS